jgi:hypothetical protein
MNPIENSRMVAQELVAYAGQKGFDLEPLRQDSLFQKDQRWIYLWRRDQFPCSGPAEEKEGTLHYNMQGAIDVLPEKLKGSAGAFQGGWTEAGTFEDIGQAFELLKAWLLDREEVDNLPGRSVRRYGIC